MTFANRLTRPTDKQTNLNAGKSARTRRTSSDTSRMIATVPKNIALGLLSGGVSTSNITGGGGIVYVMFRVSTVGSSPAETMIKCAKRKKRKTYFHKNQRY